MAIGTPVQLAAEQSISGSQGNPTLSFGAPGANQLVVVAVHWDGNLFSGGVSDNHGNTYTLAKNDARSVNSGAVELYYHYYATDPGATTVTVTLPTGGVGFSAVTIWSVSGIDSSSPLDIAVANDSLSTTITVDTSPTATSTADEIVFFILTGGYSSTESLSPWPPNTGYTGLGDQSDSSVRFVMAQQAYKIVSATGTQSATTDYVVTGHQWSGIIVTFKAAAGGGGTTYTKAGAAIAGTLVSGADAWTTNDIGAAIAGTLLSGADAWTTNKAGAATMQVVVAGADVWDATKAATAIINQVLLSGGKIKETPKSGVVIVNGAVLSGPSASEYDKSGVAVAGTLLSGADAWESHVAGAAITQALVSGADVWTAIKSGTAITKVLPSGVEIHVTPQSGTQTAEGRVIHVRFDVYR